MKLEPKPLVIRIVLEIVVAAAAAVVVTQI